MNRRLWLAIPLIVFFLFLLTVGWRLSSPPDSTIRSGMIGKQLPPLTLAPAVPGKPGLSPASPGPRLVNIFASWCVPCIAEAPLLSELQRRGVVIDGIALRDRPADVAKFLAEHGDPFARLGADPQGSAQIALGASGVPESFIVDSRGTIRFQHVGAIGAQDLPQILAEWGRAQ